MGTTGNEWDEKGVNENNMEGVGQTGDKREQQGTSWKKTENNRE